MSDFNAPKREELVKRLANAVLTFQRSNSMKELPSRLLEAQARVWAAEVERDMLRPAFETNS